MLHRLDNAMVVVVLRAVAMSGDGLVSTVGGSGRCILALIDGAVVVCIRGRLLLSPLLFRPNGVLVIVRRWLHPELLISDRFTTVWECDTFVVIRNAGTNMTRQRRRRQRCS